MLIGPHFVVFFRVSFDYVCYDGLTADGACYFDSSYLLPAAIEKELLPDCRHRMQREFQHGKAQFFIYFHNRSVAACDGKDRCVSIRFTAVGRCGVLSIRPNGFPLNRRFWRRSSRISASTQQQKPNAQQDNPSHSAILKENFQRRQPAKTSAALFLVIGMISDTFLRVRILFIGDIVGSPGRRAVRELVPLLRRRHSIDMVVANGENAAGGAGITPETADEIYEAQVDVITTGDHLWDQRTVMQLLQEESRFLRPLNYPSGTPGRGATVWRHPGGVSVAVVNLQGRAFMPALDNPFHAIDAALPSLRRKTPIILIDMHAEATSEKIAMARFLDGSITALAGTHTHVQTADEQILPGGTGFLCDAGFTGGQESVLGREVNPVIKRFLTNQPQRFGVAKKRIALHGVIFDADETTGKCLSVERLSQPLPSGED